MKRASVLTAIVSLVLVSFKQLAAQPSSVPRNIPIVVSTDQTTVLVFPAPIVGADRGSDEISTGIMKGAQNILRVKAAVQGIRPTNLTVFTSDGRLYGFSVCYDAFPEAPIYNISEMNRSDIPAPVIVYDGRLNDAEISELAPLMALKSGSLNRPRDKAGRMKLTLREVFIEKGVLFFRLDLSNRSRIPYDIDFARFYIRDGNQVKRTAHMQKELEPLYLYEEGDGAVRSRETRSIVVAAEKFTVGKGRFFTVELFEQNGDRHLAVRLRPEHIMNAKRFPLDRR